MAEAKAKTTAVIIGDDEDTEVAAWRDAHLKHGHNVIVLAPPAEDAQRMALMAYLTGLGAEIVHVFCDD
jgi:hypothetical protein